MKKLFRLTLTVVSLMLISAVFVVQAGARKDPFIGSWVSIDIDGSNQRLTIGGGPGSVYNVRYYDFGATICGLDPDTGDFLYAASARAPLTASGNTLLGSLSLYCHASPPYHVLDHDFNFTYDPITDTLSDSTGVIWHR
jgi:hypothetical protein